MQLTFGPLEKDRAGVDTGLLTIAKNCYPSTIGYGPMPSLSEYGSDALPSGCLGLFFAITNSGSYVVFSATATRLYKLVSGAWQDYTRTTGGNYATITGNRWQAAQFGSKLILVNGSDANQVIDVDSGATAFANLGGSPPVARYVWVIGDFVFLVDANNRRRLLNSAFNNPAGWTIGTDLCDEFILPDGGEIAGPGGLGSFGLLIQSGGKARRLISVEGDPSMAWRLEEIDGIRGAVVGYSTIAANGRIFYLAEDGPYSLGVDGANTPIGAHRISKEFIDNCDAARIDRFIGFADPYSTRIYWAYYKGASSTSFDGLLGYDYALDRLFFVDTIADSWSPVAIPGATLEELDASYPSIDAMTVSLDSRQFQGGRPTIGAVLPSGKLALLTGANADATLRLSPLHLVPGWRAFLSEVYPIIEIGSSASMQLWIGAQESTSKPVVWSGPHTPDPDTGTIFPRSSARLHTLELRISGEGWNNAQALQTIEQPDGRR